MDKDVVLVTIACTAYNHERYIRETLDGFVAQQTDFRFEVIVHDDASMDSTAEIIQEYACRYPDIIYPILQRENQYSQGINIDRDIILPRARGKYIAYCEGDDYWIDPRKLQKQVTFLEENPDFSASMHNCIFVDKSGNEIQSIYPMYRTYCSHRYTLKRFSRDVVYPGQTASLIFRKEAYYFDTPERSKAFYDMRVPTGDKRTFLKLLLVGDIYCFEEKMSAYRIVTSEGGSWSARNSGKNRSYLLHIASIDFRRYVRKYHARPFNNFYTTFHTGVAGIVKRLLNPTDENKVVFEEMLSEHGGFMKTALYLFGMGLLSIPFYFIREFERTRFDP